MENLELTKAIKEILCEILSEVKAGQTNNNPVELLTTANTGKRVLPAPSDAEKKVLVEGVFLLPSSSFGIFDADRLKLKWNEAKYFLATVHNLHFEPDTESGSSI